MWEEGALGWLATRDREEVIVEGSAGIAQCGSLGARCCRVERCGSVHVDGK